METKPSRNCPSCGTLLDQNADSLADGLCPRCLLAGSLHTTILGHPGASSPPPLEEVSAAFPDLEIIELIGRGGMGAVYKARQKSLDRLVALKLLPQSLAADLEFAKRFEAEAKALATLNHPNIVTVHEFGQQGGFYFLLMEYVDGPNLRSLLTDHRLSPDEALTIVPPLCEALEFAHKRNIVHRDIKPENLLLNTDGQVKIADFGIARILDQAGTDHESEKAAGTPAYMAPEQLDSPHAIDTRADIYSLGVVFYEMLTGERPNHDLTPPSGKNPSLDVRLDEVVLRALDANPDFRWQSANELNSELQTILTEQLGEPKITPPAKLPHSTPKRAWVACVLAVASIAILVASFFVRHHVVPVSEAEHEVAINQWFEHLVENADLQTRIKELDAKQAKTPADRELRETLWDQATDDQKGWDGLELFGALKGVVGPPTFNYYEVHTLANWISGILGGVALILGLRHLSWLRGQQEPLPALVAGTSGASLFPLFLMWIFILKANFKMSPSVNWHYHFGLPALALAAAIIISIWTVRRLLAWTRNRRSAPSFSVAGIAAIVLIALAIAIPFTAARQSYRTSSRELVSQSIELERSHQEYILHRMASDRKTPGEEKLKEARSQCEAYAKMSQASKLLTARPIKLMMPKGPGLFEFLIWSPLALLGAFVLLSFRRFRTRRS
ncbi:MAG: serine/threonine protein kinase [Akkermansiaceae bacterium]|nr:serine/threonine protein kinase [Akkermansiaceae bacterium]NNM29537.1 serine/threonine protein kinase [Akkermansiaceae bacterium]